MSGIDQELLRFATLIEDADLPCMIVGSVASMVFGEPRSTLDIDLVVAASPDDAQRLIAAFDPQRYYVPPVEVIRRELGRNKGAFNIIDNETSLKADIYVQGADEWNAYGFAHRVVVDIPDFGPVHVAPPTCVIAGKLRFFAMSRQDKHLRDIRGMLAMDAGAIERERLARLADQLGISDAWKSCLERAGEE